MSHDDITTAEPDFIVTPEDVLDANPALKGMNPRWLQVICRAATEKIHRVTRRRIIRDTYTEEKHWGNGEFDLRMDNAPIESVTEVRFRGSIINGISISDASTGLLYNPSRWSSLPAWDRKNPVALSDGQTSDPFFREDFFAQGDGNPPWEVDYVAGFAEIPFELRLAAIEMVKFRLTVGDQTGLKSETIGGYSYTADKEEDKQPFMKDIRRYRIRSFARR